MSTTWQYSSFPRGETLNFDFLENHDTVAFLRAGSQSNNWIIGLDAIDRIVINDPNDALAELESWRTQHSDRVFGHFSYEMNAGSFGLDPKNKDNIGSPVLHFFRPRSVIELLESEVRVGYHDPDNSQDAKYIVDSMCSRSDKPNEVSGCDLQARVDRKRYLEHVKALKSHIAQGDIYEVNYCIEFYQQNIVLDPIRVFDRLVELTDAPHACYYKQNGIHVLCGSPERFLRSANGVLTSEPMKGTARRGDDPKEDEQLRMALKMDKKERSENVMIVDLVRNDLSKHAARNSVEVEQLFDVRTFKTAHQMVSKIKAVPLSGVSPETLIGAAFPMGSMTGAPKHRAMQLINEHESMQRGIYSGSIGYIDPNGDFDLNVVIRSIVYNEKTKKLSVMVGSAITAASDPEKEYAECLLKAEAMMSALN